MDYADVYFTTGFPSAFELECAAPAGTCLAVGTSDGSGPSPVAPQACRATATSQMWQWEI